MVKKVEMVVPCYNEQDCIRPLFEEIKRVFDVINDKLPIGEQYSYSILYVNDGSKDNTLYEIKKLADEVGSSVIKYISFARNFGKESAIYAGFEKCEGDYIVLMDADLQHPPTLIAEMLKVMEEGYDCVGARRVSRKGEPRIRSFFSHQFYSVFTHMTGIDLVPGGSDYRMMTKQMVDSVVSLTERERFIKGIMSWVGFDTKWIEYENVERYAGQTKWSFWGLAKYAWNGFVSFATTPLRAVVYMGLLVVLVAAIWTIKIIVDVAMFGTSGNGIATLMVMIMFFSGIIITILGVIGEYMARIYLEIKHRPIYISKESNIALSEEGKKHTALNGGPHLGD